jgi:hypothetical protein
MDRRERLSRNPFFVLGLAPDAPRAELERTAQKLLGMLALGASAAKRYRTPVGEHERTEDAVRTAISALRDPRGRLLHELWATSVEPTDDIEQLVGASPRWTTALSDLGLAPGDRSR